MIYLFPRQERRSGRLRFSIEGCTEDQVTSFLLKDLNDLALPQPGAQYEVDFVAKLMPRPQSHA